MRPLVLLPLVLLTACSSVSTEEIDEFGMVWSTLWMRLSYEGDESHSLLAINATGACGHVQDYYEAYAELMEMDYGDDYCEEAADAVAQMSDAAGALFYDGARQLTAQVYDEEGETEPEEESYEVGGDDARFYGTVAYFHDELWGHLEDWDEDGDPSEGCGVEYEDEPDVDYWSFDDGSELDISAVADEASLTAVLDADLVDDEGENAGGIAANLSATFCDIDL